MSRHDTRLHASGFGPRPSAPLVSPTHHRFLTTSIINITAQTTLRPGHAINTAGQQPPGLDMWDRTTTGDPHTSETPTPLPSFLLSGQMGSAPSVPVLRVPAGPSIPRRHFFRGPSPLRHCHRYPKFPTEQTAPPTRQRALDGEEWGDRDKPNSARLLHCKR